MNNQIQLVLKSSTTELSLNDHELGIYLTPELDGLTGLPEIRTTSGVNAGYDGGWTSAQNYDARSITLRGVIANEDVATVEQLRRQLTTLAGQGKNEELTLDLVTQAGKAYTIQVRTIALEMSLQKVLTQQEFMLQLRADDPLIYDASETTHEALLQVAQATGGFTIDFELPLAITGSSEETVVNNEGLEQVPTVTRMYGALHNPKLINQTTNQSMQIMADLGYAEGDWTTPSEPVEGKDLIINGAPENALLSDFRLKGDTYQQTYTGKNLLPIQLHLGDQGITASYDANSGLITVGGTPTAEYPQLTTAYSLPNPILSGSNITFSAYQFPSNVKNIYIRLYGESGSTYTIYDLTPSTTSKSFTISSDAYRIMLILRCTVGTAISGSFGLQLEAASSASSFEPYTNGPSPTPDYPQPVQAVTGENVVKICGKNLFDGETVNGWLNASGVLQTSSSDRTSTNYIAVTPNTTYTLYGTQSTYLKLTQFDSSKIAASQQTTTSATSITVTTGATTAYVRIGWGNAANASNVMLEKSSTATDYEPYRGQSYEINLGKNLFDKDNANIINAYISGGHVITGNTNDRCVYIPCEPNTTYAVQKMLQGTTSKNRFRLGTSPTVPQLDTSLSDYWNAGDGSTTTTHTITTGASAHYLVVYIYTTDSATTFETMLGSIQIEKGSQVTSYATYFTPIELCGLGTYQDYIYKSDGKWYVHKEVGKVLIGDYDWSAIGTAQSGKSRFQHNFTADVLMPFSNNSQATPYLLCPYYERRSAGGTYSNVVGIAEATAWVIFYDESLASGTAANFKAARADVPIYYVKATPTDTEITNEALVAQLEAILQEAKMYNPQTNITTLYAVGNEQGTLSISYFTDKNPDTRDELIIDSRLRTITLNGLDVYHLQAPGSEFLMLAPGENRLSLQSDITGDNGYAQVSYKQGYLSI